MESETHADLSEPQRLHPATLVQRLLVALPPIVLVALPLWTSADASAAFTVGLTLFVSLLTVPAVVAQYLRFRYWATDEAVIIQSGVLSRRHRSIPLDRIQNVEIERGILARIFGTAKVRLETAGSSSTEGVIEQVSMTQAEALREQVRRQRLGLPRDGAEEEETLEEVEAKELVLLELGQVLLAGAFQFSLVYIVAIFSLAQYANVDPATWLQRALRRGQYEAWVEAASQAPWLAGVLTALAVALFGWLTGMALTINRVYGFRLTEEDGKLHKRSGLLTLSERTIPLPRIQALLLRSGPLTRLFGWWRLEAQTVGVDPSEGGYQTLSPLIRLADAERLAARVVPGARLPEGFRPVSKKHIRRLVVRYLVPLVAGTGVLAYYTDPVAWWLLLLVPALVALAWRQWQRHGYALEEGFLYVRSGAFERKVWMLPAGKVQVLYGEDTVFQQRLGVRTVYADTAGARARLTPDVRDLPADEADALVTRLYDALQAQRPPRRASSLPPLPPVPVTSAAEG